MVYVTDLESMEGIFKQDAFADRIHTDTTPVAEFIRLLRGGNYGNPDPIKYFSPANPDPSLICSRIPSWNCSIVRRSLEGTETVCSQKLAGFWIWKILNGVLHYGRNPRADPGPEEKSPE